MAKKNGGLFGGLFDFNGDGKTDLGEEFIAYKIFEECMKGSDDTDDDFPLDDDLDLDLIPSKDYSWRSYCEDGSEFCIFPEDYETEEEYEQALEEAKDAGGGITLSLSVECPALDKPEEIKESDFPNKRRYNAAYTLENEFICYSSDEHEQREKDCCKFILEKADTVPAANYLSHEAGFLYTFWFDFVLTSDDAKAFLYADSTKRRVHSRNDITVKVNI